MRDGQQAQLGAQGIGRSAEGASVPMAVGVDSDVLDPAAEALQRVGGERAQFRAGGLLVGQPGVQHLLQGPGGLAEFVEAHHARAALERMERTAQRRHFGEALRLLGERLQRGQAIGHDLARFLQEDLQQFVVAVVVDHRCRDNGCRCGLGGDGHAHRHGSHRCSDHSRGRGRGHCSGNRCGSGRKHRRQFQRRQFGQAGHGCCDRRRRSRLRDRGRRSFGRVLLGPAHQRPQFAALVVPDEQLLGQRRLVVQHVDQEAERAQVVAKLVEGAGSARLLFLDLGGDDVFHRLAHAHDGLRGLVQPQHRQHAAHLLQEARGVAQRALVGRIAEELVQQLLELAHGAAQFADDAAHGLLVAHAPVQVFDPVFQRLGVAALQHLLQAFGKAGRAVGQLLVVGVQVLERGLEVEDGRGDFHRQFGTGRTVAAHHVVDGRAHRLCQRLAAGIELLQGVGQGMELLADRLDLVAVAAREARPGFLGRGDALAQLVQEHRVEAAEGAGAVVDRPGLVQAIALAHRGQRGRIGGPRGQGLRAEEHEVLRQALGHVRVALGERCVLQQHARGGALDVQVGGQQAQRDRLEVAAGDLPEDLRLARGLRGGEARGHLHEVAAGCSVGRLDDAQYRMVHAGAHGRVVAQGMGDGRSGEVVPAPVHAPQVRGVDAVGAGEVLHVLVLQEQRHGRHALAAEERLEEFGQREAGALHLGSRHLGAQLGPFDEPLHRGFHAAQHVRGRGHAHHLQRTDCLVHVLAGDAQLTGIDRSHVLAARLRRVAHEAPQRRRSRFERLAQLVQHPGQRAQVIVWQVVVLGCCLHRDKGLGTRD